MAESENSRKPPNQAESETQAQPKIESEEEAADEENLVSPPEKSVHSLTPIVVPNFTTETSQSQTLTFSSLISPSDHDPDCHSFSELLAGAMASPTNMSPGSVSKPTVSMIDLPPALDPAGFKGQFGMSHQEALATVTAQAQAQRQLQAGPLHILPTSLEQSMVFAMSPTLKREFPPVSQDHTASTPQVNQKASFDPKTGHVNVLKETPCSDGYSWRKYGQKQVKSNERSRSYYKCTDSSCHAKKKVESCDHSGHVMEIVYKGQHNHEPPRKIRSIKASGCVSSAGAIVCVDPGRGNGVVEHPVKELNIPAPSRPQGGEPCYATCKEIVPVSNDSGRDAGVRHGEEQGDEPQPKRRMKNNRVASSTPQIKTIKDPKVVVQAAGDVGTSIDGYRWRKYGQKMVKGNPSPRSYYRCTSAGCPVRKHVDKAIDEAAGIIITYEGKHDHDMPVPKKRNGPPNTLLIADTCAVNGGKLKSSETSLDQKPSIPLAVEKGDPTGKNTTELGGEKEKVDPTGEKAVEFGGEKEKGDPPGEKAVELGGEKKKGETLGENAVELGGEKEKGDPPGEKGTEVGGEKVLESARTLLSIGIELKPY